MFAYTIKRLLHAVPILIVSTILVFLLLHLSPGDPVNMLVAPDASQEEIEAVRAELGLDRPLVVQYFVWIGNVLQGDLGRSFLNRQPVATLIAGRFPATLELAVAAIILAVILSFPFGIASALNVNGPIDWLITSATAIALAAPNFWVGILAILLFAVTLRWLPPGGRVPFSQDPTLGGAVIIEAVFGWPGIGRLLVTAIRQQDFPVAQGVLLALAGIFILVNLSVDILYGVIDPRVRFGKGRNE